jgi:AcrR family transcriptional regulator
MVDRRAAPPGNVRQRLIASATRLFAAKGFDATPIQDIADELGLTKAALLHHFPSKEKLRREVLDAILSHWAVALPRLLLAATASDERFDAVLGELYRFFAAEPERARFIAREVMDRPAEAKKMLRGVLPAISALAGYIRTGQTHGRHYEDVDPEAYLVHILQFVIGAAAVSDVTAGALGTGAEQRARYDRELARIAKASLFVPRNTDGAARASARVKRDGRRQ